MGRKKDWQGEYRLGKGKKMKREGRKTVEGEILMKFENMRGRGKGEGGGEKMREGKKMRRKEEEEKEGKMGEGRCREIEEYSNVYRGEKARDGRIRWWKCKMGVGRRWVERKKRDEERGKCGNGERIWEDDGMEDDGGRGENGERKKMRKEEKIEHRRKDGRGYIRW